MRPHLFLIWVFLFAGCASVESLDRFYDEINWKDGVNRNEAALIAKKWLMESKYEGAFQMIAPVSTGYDNYWQISFLYKSLDYYEKVLDVYVDTLTGEVKGSEIRHRGTPNVAKDSKF
jgi:hypothetical protein